MSRFVDVKKVVMPVKSISNGCVINQISWFYKQIFYGKVLQWEYKYYT